jgi:arylsulfatase A-like enzyme
MALLLAAALLAPAAAPADDLPNVVLLMSDDQGWADVGYNQATYNGTHIARPLTPELDAMAASRHSLVFRRFYAGSAVCSPTRASVLTGRTSQRECIFGAEGCGQQPAWRCADKMPLPPTAFTIAEAAKQRGYATVHVGKWHLGDFFPKPALEPNASQALRRWPVSHPGVHGFDDWHSTEASAASTTPNCGCFADNGARQCVMGGAVVNDSAFRCTNYWSPEGSAHGRRPSCQLANASDRGCVSNLTTPVVGDDSAYVVATFDAFLQRQPAVLAGSRPFLAALWLHTVHVPHPALPHFFGLYPNAEDGDYLGTLSQMDAAVGRLRQLLVARNLSSNTMLWYTSDNGPTSRQCGGVSPAAMGGRQCTSLSTGGLRQCKGSLFEGGIRVPGMLEWPARITVNRWTDMPVSVLDYLPTTLELIGVVHPQPHWARDGISLLPLIDGAMTARPQPIGWSLDGQSAWMDNDWKMVWLPNCGFCPHWEPPWTLDNTRIEPLLFNLKSDPTEAVNLRRAQPVVFERMQGQLRAFLASIEVSAEEESGCSMPRLRNQPTWGSPPS